MARDTVTHEIVEIYPMGSTPKSKAGKAAHADSWRRDTAAEAAAKPASKSRSKQGG